MSLRKMIGRLSIKGDQYSLTIQLFFFSNPVFKKQSKYWVADIRVPHFKPTTSWWLLFSVPPFSSALPYWSSWRSFLLIKQSGRCNEWIREPFVWDMLFCQQWTTERISDLLQKQNKVYTDGLGSQPVNCNTKLLLVRKLSIVPELNYEKLLVCLRKRMLSDLELKMEKMFNIVVFHHHK